MRHSPQSFEPLVSDLLAASWLARQFQSVSHVVETAYRNSRVLPVATEWRSRVRADAGVVLIAAAAAHVALLAIDGMAGGWLRLVLPFTTAACGAVALVARSNRLNHPRDAR